jgi:hypothetical protein
MIDRQISDLNQDTTCSAAADIKDYAACPKDSLFAIAISRWRDRALWQIGTSTFLMITLTIGLMIH